jgi:hypothetical protein
MKIIDNVTDLLGDDLQEELLRSQRAKVSAASFSIHAFAALEPVLTGLRSFDFVFTGPSFVTDGGGRAAHREFLIPPVMQKRDLAGTGAVRLPTQPGLSGRPGRFSWPSIRRGSGRHSNRTDQRAHDCRLDAPPCTPPNFWKIVIEIASIAIPTSRAWSHERTEGARTKEEHWCAAEASVHHSCRVTMGRRVGIHTRGAYPSSGLFTARFSPSI